MGHTADSGQLLASYRRGDILLQDLFVIRQSQLGLAFNDLVDRVPNRRASILVQIKWGNVFRLTDYWLAVVAKVLQLPLEEFKEAHQQHLRQLAVRQLFAAQAGDERDGLWDSHFTEGKIPNTLADQQTILAQRIVDSLAQSQLTVRSAAEQIGISPTSLWRYSQGKSLPGPDAWQAISTYFNIDISDLPLAQHAIWSHKSKGRRPTVSTGRLQ